MLKTRFGKEAMFPLKEVLLVTISKIFALLKWCLCGGAWARLQNSLDCRIWMMCGKQLFIFFICTEWIISRIQNKKLKYYKRNSCFWKIQLASPLTQETSFIVLCCIAETCFFMYIIAVLKSLLLLTIDFQYSNSG